MIYVTGDTHGITDNIKLLWANLKKGDTVIIAGDFGGVWYGDSRDSINWYNDRKFTTLFVDGNHENHDILDKYPVSVWNGGKVHKIRENVIHLMRGQVYEIEGLKFFTFGGADSIDKLSRVEGLSWWKREMPSYNEYVEGLKNLDKYKWDVDYVITHTCPVQIMSNLLEDFTATQLERYLGEISKDLKFKKWYFGHFHIDKEIDKFIALYNAVIHLR